MNIDKFKSPPREYQPVPFWSWNDRLEKEELLWQINEMDKQHIGGFFMHSRKGLETTYLSDEWMQRIRECIDEAKERGMYAWLYDEDKWPSGFCGGQIPKLGPEYCQKALLMRENDLELPESEVELLKVYICSKVGDKKYTNLIEISEQEAEVCKKNGQTVLYFYKWTQPIGPNRFNNSAWVDLLNPNVTDAFIESTHEKYRTAVGEEFGSTVPGIFTDESSILYWSYAPKAALPWSQEFETYFMEFKGYSILDYLPYLFINLEGFEKIRYDYWHTVTYSFAQNYVKRIYDWCESNNLKLTGHFIAEDYFEFTMQYIGSLMPLYEYMHIPGLDHLNRNINDIMTVKQVTSVADQLGKERALCEMFGCSGQNMSFEDQKWILDWAYINGVNLTNAHLSLYSMRGERKRDYPPNLYYQQPWWEFNHKMSDYISRLSYMLTRGERVTDVLVLHTMESAWCTYNPTDMVLEEEGQFDTPDTWIEYKPDRNFKTNELSYDFDDILNMLYRLHYDYDLGDEALMDKYGKVQEDHLFVGRKGYKAVLVPPCITIRKTTAHILQSFMKCGGKVIFTNSYPTLIDGRVDSEGILNKLAERADLVLLDEGSIKETLASSTGDIVRIEGRKNETVWYHLRKDGEDTIAFFANTDKEEGKVVDIFIKSMGDVKELDLLSGEVKDICYSVEDGITRIRHSFAPCGSLMIVIDEDGKARGSNCRKDEAVLTAWELKDQWEVKALGVNSISIDCCKLTDGSSAAFGKMPTHRVLDRVNKVKGEFSLAYTFENGDWDGTGGRLVMESPSNFRVEFNGTDISERFGDDYWVDKSFKTADIEDIVRTGTNEIKLWGKWSEGIEIESVYITGRFEVKNIDNMEFITLNPSYTTAGGNIVNKGYPFFTGSMEFKQSWNLGHKNSGRYFLEIEQEGSIVVQALVNGKLAGDAIWRPYKFEITEYLNEGENQISLVLTTSLHNLLGPHHSQKGEVIACAPASFRDERNWTDRYNFVELGIQGARILNV